MEKKSRRKVMITYARGAVQDAEDARVSTMRKLQQEKEHQQQVATQQAQDAAQQAQTEAQQEALKRAQADAAASQAEAAAANARAAQAAAEHDTQQETEQMRERLRAQLGQVLQTQETARGLIVNMSDVLFDTAKYTLKPEARDKLSKVSGILLAYPNLKVQVEGYTDNIGGDQYNLTLSQQRGDAVRSYLISQSVATDNITATGYGMSSPIADNTTAAWRAQNRRVQMVASGSAIGVQQTQPSAANPPQGGITPVQSTNNPSQ